MRRLLCVVLSLAACAAGATETTLLVKVKARGAKFIGTSMGGARITVRDALSGEVLAQGVTFGGTGDTEKIMRDARPSSQPVGDASAASWRVVLDINAPRELEIEAVGPLAQRQALARASTSIWMIPGRDITGGDGIVLELSGLVVDVLGPPTPLRLKGVPRDVPITANVTMLCGCPLTPGGLWDTDRILVHARVLRDGVEVADVPLAYAGEPSQFRGTVTTDRPGTWEAEVYAFDPTNGNSGLDAVTFEVEP